MKNLFTSLVLTLFVTVTAFAQFNGPVTTTLTAPSGSYSETFTVTGHSPNWLVDPQQELIKIDVPGASSIDVEVEIELSLDENGSSADVENLSWVQNNDDYNVVEGGNYPYPSGDAEGTFNGNFNGIANGSLLSVNLELYDDDNVASTTATYTITYTSN